MSLICKSLYFFSTYLWRNITSDVDALENNQKANVKAVFYLNDGTKYATLPLIDLNITTVNGVVNKDTAGIDSDVLFTLTAFSDAFLTVSFNDFTTAKTFEFLKTNPVISLTTEDIMVGDNVTLTVTLPIDAEGNLTVNVGANSQTKVIDSSKMIFTFNDLKADSYVISADYTGDRKYQSKTVTSSVVVNKFESSTDLLIGTVNVGEDVVLTITTTDSATGNVTLLINNNPETLLLENSKAEYTIKNIVRGDYLIAAVYNGDDRYLSSQTSKFIEVDNLNASMKIEAEDITYGDVAVIKVVLNDDAVGEVFVNVDGVTNSSGVVGGRAEVSFTNLDAGQNKTIIVFYTGDDTYFNLTNTSSFNITKSDLEFNISSGDIKIGQPVEIFIKVPSRTGGTFTIRDDVISIPMSGEVSYLIYDLEIGNYTFTATYNGNNYNTVSKSVSVEVSEYPIPQWSGEGGNPENSHKTIYESDIDGAIVLTVPFNETLTGELVLDSMGNVYLTTRNGVYCYSQDDCLWYFTSNLTAGNFSGICIGRDVVIAPKSGDTLYFINQTSGERYGDSNIYEGSSLFAPVIDSNANLYIVSEYQRISEDYKLTIIPYRLWESGSDPTLVSIGDTRPLWSPTLNEHIIVVVSEGRLRIIDAETFETISTKGGDYSAVRPVIGDGDIVYAVLSDSVVAYNAAGVQIWKTKVVGGVGDRLVIDPEIGLYHVNARGILYRFDLVDGSDSKISNLKVTSGILIDNKGNLYFGSNNVFYAMNPEGNILWQSDLGSQIVGSPVMNREGMIYVATGDNKLVVLYNSLTDPELEVRISNITEGEDAVITVIINNQTTGNVSFTLDGVFYSFGTSNGTITKVIPGLGVGTYSVNVTYPGDLRFNRTSNVVTFTVSEKILLDPELQVTVSNITEGDDAVITVRINNQTTGNVSFTLDGVDYSFETGDGLIVCKVPNLEAGTYTIDVVYSGDSRFNKTIKSATFTVKSDVVLLLDPNLEVNIPDISYGDTAVITIKINNETTGNVSFTLNGVDYSFETGDGTIVCQVPNLKAGTYAVNVTYPGDLRFNESCKLVSFVVKGVVSPSVAASGSVVNINLASDATGTVTVKVNGKTYTKQLVNGKASVTLPDGSYDAVITYSGDAKYAGFTITKHVTVKKLVVKKASKIVAKKKTFKAKTKVKKYTVSLKSGKIPIKKVKLIIKIKKKTYKATTNSKGKATFKIKKLTKKGKYTAIIKFAGNKDYKTTSKKVKIFVK